MNLQELGWNKYFEKQFKEVKNHQDYLVARVAVEYKNMYKLYTEQAEFLGEITGKMRFNNQFPAVGDWVYIKIQSDNRAIIHGLLSRKSKFCRKVAGDVTEEQLVAANIDIIFIVSSLNQELNLRRIERYLTIAWDSGAKPVVILSKADLCADQENIKCEVESVAYGVPVHIVSAVTRQGIAELNQYIDTGITVALLGSSGVGKSTLINCISGDDLLETRATREDDKGRHTTTNRQMILLKNSGIIIDTPGMREIQLWEGEDGIKSSFADIQELTTQCFFNDCRHESEPDCAVKAAIANGELAEERLTSYRKLQRELKYIEAKKQRGSKGIEKMKYQRIFGKKH